MVVALINFGSIFFSSKVSNVGVYAVGEFYPARFGLGVFSSSIELSCFYGAISYRFCSAFSDFCY